MKAVALGIALRFATRQGHHHCQIAPMLAGVAHTFVKESGLQSTTPPLWNCGRTAEQRDAFMQAQYPGGTGLAVKLPQKA